VSTQTPSFAGVDLTFYDTKASAYALLGADQAGLKLLQIRSYYADSEIVAAIETDHPTLVGIDAPLSKPTGLHCFNRQCACVDPPDGKGRQCELDLAREGIPSYFTGKNSFIAPLINRGIRLKNELNAKGFEVLEVYPYASKHMLWRGRIPAGERTFPKKTSGEGRRFLHCCLSDTIDLAGNGLLNHDQYDAILAAYTVYLHHQGRSRLVGHTAEGQIAVPR